MYTRILEEVALSIPATTAAARAPNRRRGEDDEEKRIPSGLLAGNGKRALFLSLSLSLYQSGFPQQVAHTLRFGDMVFWD
jgi:hypothetical protein